MEPVVWYKRGAMAAYMPSYHKKLHKLWWKLKNAGEKHNPKELYRYQEIYEKIWKREQWNQEKQAALAMQNDLQYFKDNPIRKCPKCGHDVLAGSNKCLKEHYRSTYHGHDSTATAYYVGDYAAGEYRTMFHDLFAPCLAKFPKCDTLKYENERIGPNMDRE